MPQPTYPPEVAEILSFLAGPRPLARVRLPYGPDRFDPVALGQALAEDMLLRALVPRYRHHVHPVIAQEALPHDPPLRDLSLDAVMLSRGPAFAAGYLTSESLESLPGAEGAAYTAFLFSPLIAGGLKRAAVAGRKRLGNQAARAGIKAYRAVKPVADAASHPVVNRFLLGGLGALGIELGDVVARAIGGGGDAASAHGRPMNRGWVPLPEGYATAEKTMESGLGMDDLRTLKRYLEERER